MIASGRRGLRSIPASVCPTASPRLPRAERDTTLAAKARTVCRQSSVDGGRIVSAENPGGASASTGSRPSSAVPASAKASTYSAGRKTASLTAWLQRAACTRSEPAQSAPSRPRPAKVTLARGRPARGGDGATPARAATRTAGCTPTFSTTLSARRPPGSRVWSPVATTNTGTAAGRRRTARGNRPIPGGPHHRRSRRGSCGWCLPAPRDAREPGQGDGPPSPRWRCPGKPGRQPPRGSSGSRGRRDRQMPSHGIGGEGAEPGPLGFLGPEGQDRPGVTVEHGGIGDPEVLESAGLRLAAEGQHGERPTRTARRTRVRSARPPPRAHRHSLSAEGRLGRRRG